MRTAVWITLTALAGIWIIIAFATVDRSDDQAKIEALITRGVTATQNRDVTTLVSCLSRDYKDETLRYDQLRVLLAQAFSNETSFRVCTSAPVVKIEGDHATVTMDVELKHRPGDSTFYKAAPTLFLRKQDARHMLIAPEKVWRVVGSEGLKLGIAAGEVL